MKFVSNAPRGKFTRRFCTVSQLHCRKSVLDASFQTLYMNQGLLCTIVCLSKDFCVVHNLAHNDCCKKGSRVQRWELLVVVLIACQ